MQKRLHVTVITPLAKETTRISSNSWCRTTIIFYKEETARLSSDTRRTMIISMTEEVIRLPHSTRQSGQSPGMIV